MTDDQATAAYFAHTADGPFEHQRDAYEQGYEDGRAQGAATERKSIRRLAVKHGAKYPGACEDWPNCPDGKHFKSHYKMFADLLDGTP